MTKRRTLFHVLRQVPSDLEPGERARSSGASQPPQRPWSWRGRPTGELSTFLVDSGLMTAAKAPLSRAGVQNVSSSSRVRTPACFSDNVREFVNHST
jgi:hypothetical protein